MTPLDDHQKLHFEIVWGKDVSLYRELILEMWRQNRGPVGAEAMKRLGQLVSVITGEQGEMVGVSTAFKAHVKQLRNYFFIVRLMVTPERRSSKLALKLLVSTRDFLESLHEAKSIDAPIGIIVLVQKGHVSSLMSEAIWPESKMAYIGNTAEGHQIRVYYFKGARIVP